MKAKRASSYVQRRPGGAVVLRPSITLRPDRDADLIQALEAALAAGVPVAAFIREGLRSGLAPVQAFTPETDSDNQIDLLALVADYAFDEEGLLP